jgi:hypothetical protein
MEMIKMRDTEASAIIKALNALFARTGYHFELASDNGLEFKNVEMKQFTRQNKVKSMS